MHERKDANLTDTALATIADIPPDELAVILDTEKDTVKFNKYFKLDGLGATIKGDPPIEAWGAMLKALKTAGRMLPIWVGDLLNDAEAKWGEMYSQYLDMADYGTLRNWKWVMGAVPRERRVEGLTLTHLCRVASLPAREQARYLKKAAEEGLSANALERLIREKHQLPGPSPPPEVLLECFGKLVSTDKGWVCELHTAVDLSKWTSSDVSISITEVKRA